MKSTTKVQAKKNGTLTRAQKDKLLAGSPDRLRVSFAIEGITFSDEEFAKLKSGSTRKK